MSEKVLMKGNEALAEAAISAGCRHFFGYPITPQTEVAAYMAKKLPKIGGTFLQVGYTFLIGAMCGIITVKTGNVLLSATAHIVYNFCGMLIE